MSDNEIKIVINADDKASQTIAGVTKSLKSVVNAVSDLTDKYVSYGDQVKDMSSFTRMSAEETSRMIQVADDAFVEYDTLKLAMKNMVDNGIQPSVDSMARMSDQFLAITDPLAQSQFLIDQFGQRAGPEMAKLLEIGGAGIRQMAADTQAGLVIDQQKLEAITKNKQAVDAFNDSMDAMRYDAAAQMLGIFQQLPAPIQNTALALKMATDTGIINGLANMAIILNNIGGLKAALTAVGGALQGVAAGAWAVIGPAAAVAAAILAVGYAVYKLIEFIGMLGDMFNKLMANGKFWEFIQALTPYNILKNIDLGASLNWALPGRASGGPVTAGRAYMVGEEGPETFVPGMSGTILPTGSLVGAGSANFTLVYSPTFSLANQEELQTKLEPLIRRVMRGH